MIGYKQHFVNKYSFPYSSVPAQLIPLHHKSSSGQVWNMYLNDIYYQYSLQFCLADDRLVSWNKSLSTNKIAIANCVNKWVMVNYRGKNCDSVGELVSQQPGLKGWTEILSTIYFIARLAYTFSMINHVINTLNVKFKIVLKQLNHVR